MQRQVFRAIPLVIAAALRSGLPIVTTVALTLPRMILASPVVAAVLLVMSAQPSLAQGGESVPKFHEQEVPEPLVPEDLKPPGEQKPEDEFTYTKKKGAPKPQPGGTVADKPPPGVAQFDCLTDEAKRQLEFFKKQLAGPWAEYWRLIKELEPLLALEKAEQRQWDAEKKDAKALVGLDPGEALNTNNKWDDPAKQAAAQELRKQFDALVEKRKLVQKQIKAIKAVTAQIERLNRIIDYLKSLPPCIEEKKTEGGGGGGGGGKKSPPKKKYGKRQTTGGGHPYAETISLVTGTDSETWCTYGPGIEVETTLIATDEEGNPIEVAIYEEMTEEPTLAEIPPAGPTSDATPQPTQSTAEPPQVTEGQPEQPPETPETPQVPTERLETPETPEITEKPPEEPPSTPIPDTIFVKAKESVLEGKPTGSPIENQVVKLFPAEEPALPGTGGTKEAEDTGFDKDPVECTTDADGNCKLHIPTEDRALYDLPNTDTPGNNYRADYDLPKQSGGVAETTDKGAEPDVKTGTPAGAEVTAAQFRIGDRTFVRLVYEQPYGLKHDFDEQFKPIFGESYEEDYCREKQPGPPLGMQPSSYSALNHALPEATVKLEDAFDRLGDAP